MSAELHCVSFRRTVRGGNRSARGGEGTARGGNRSARGAGCSARACAAVHALKWLKNRGAVRSRFRARTVDSEGTSQTLGSTKEKEACSTVKGACTTWEGRAVGNRADF